MDALAAFAATHNMYVWIVGGLLFLCLFGPTILIALYGLARWAYEIFEDWMFYFNNRDVFDRQNELENWLQEKFDEVGIPVSFIKWEYAGSFKRLASVLEEANLFFRATVTPEKVGAYKRIVGVALNRFPWAKISPEGRFSPSRHLNRAWAKEYGLSRYSHPFFGAPCKCGCNQVRILHFEMQNLGEISDSEVTLAYNYGYTFDCKTYDPYIGELANEHEKAPMNEVVVKLPTEKIAWLNTEIARREEELDRRRRAAEEQRQGRFNRD